VDDGDAAAEVAAAVLESTEEMEDMVAHSRTKGSQLQELLWCSRTTYAEEGWEDEKG
jgi:hypothetical protein